MTDQLYYEKIVEVREVFDTEAANKLLSTGEWKLLRPADRTTTVQVGDKLGVATQPIYILGRIEKTAQTQAATKPTVPAVVKAEPTKPPGVWKDITNRESRA